MKITRETLNMARQVEMILEDLHRGGTEDLNEDQDIALAEALEHLGQANEILTHLDRLQ